MKGKIRKTRAVQRKIRPIKLKKVKKKSKKKNKKNTKKSTSKRAKSIKRIPKMTIFYFSGTGNCLKVARDLIDELSEDYNTKLIPIPTALNKNNTEKSEKYLQFTDPTIGIISPVYFGGLPEMVVNFLKKLYVDAGVYTYMIITHGGGPANALKQAKDILHSRHMDLHSGFEIHMPSNYTPLSQAPPLARQETLFREETKKIRRIVEVIRYKKHQPIEHKSIFPLNYLHTFIYKLCIKRVHKMDKKFWINDKCNGCEICAKVCPVDNIEINDRQAKHREGMQPVWTHKCQQCLACLQWCPMHAIELGRFTRGRKRYTNPEVEVKDFFLNTQSMQSKKSDDQEGKG